jgi:hypothetical protein
MGRRSAAVLVLAECAAGGGEVVARIEIGVAQKIERAAVEPVGAGLGDYADLSAGKLSVLGIEVAGDDAELGDRIEVGNDGGAGVHVLLDVAAVDAEVVGEFPLAVDGDGAGIQVPEGARVVAPTS